MAATLRRLLVQRAARLQERPALTAPGWGTLSYGQFRNRVEGVALGLLAAPCPTGTAVFLTEPSPWTWAAEVAAACCGLRWEAEGECLDPALLGGTRFNSEEGRGPYHDREDAVHGGLPFHGGLDQEAVLARLVRLNGRLGWDHDSRIALPLEHLATPEVRAALWSALYAGAHADFGPAGSGPRRWFSRVEAPAPFDAAPFVDFWKA